MNTIATLGWLRFKLFTRGLRGGAGVLDLASGIVLSVFFLLASLGAATLFGLMIWQSEHPVDPDFLRILYYAAFCTFTFCGVILPLLVESGRQGLGIDRLHIFPIGRRSLFGISLGSCLFSPEHVLYYPALLTVCIVGIVVPGFAVVPGLLLVLSLLCFNLIWGHALALGLEAIGRKRRGREVVGVVVVVVVILCATGPTLLDRFSPSSNPLESSLVQDLTGGLARVGRSLAPALAAEGLTALRRGESLAGLQALLWLWVWIACGAGLGYRLFTRHALGEGGDGRRRVTAGEVARTKRRLPSLSLATVGRIFLSRGAVAVAAKDWRYLMRSVNGRLALAIVPIMAAVILAIVRRWIDNPILGIDAGEVAVLGVLVYVTQLGNNLFYNSLAWEGRGVQSYYLFPVAPREILLGKNLATWCFFGLVLILVTITLAIVNGVPDATSLLTCLLFFAALVVPFTTIGNFMSLSLPVPKKVSSRDSSFSQTGLLLSVVIMFLVGGVTMAFVALPGLLGRPELRLHSLGLLLVLQGILYLIMLPRAAGMLVRNRERIIGRLAGGG